MRTGCGALVLLVTSGPASGSAQMTSPGAASRAEATPTVLLLASQDELIERAPALSIELADAGYTVASEPMAATPDAADAMIAARATGARTR